MSIPIRPASDRHSAHYFHSLWRGASPRPRIIDIFRYPSWLSRACRSCEASPEDDITTLRCDAALLTLVESQIASLNRGADGRLYFVPFYSPGYITRNRRLSSPHVIRGRAARDGVAFRSAEPRDNPAWVTGVCDVNEMSPSEKRATDSRACSFTERNYIGHVNSGRARTRACENAIFARARGSGPTFRPAEQRLSA